jgi:hypothetical protein
MVTPPRRRYPPGVEPELAVATAPDGVRIGWTSVGSGSALVHLPGVPFSNVDAEIGSFQEILAQKLYDLDGRAWARESGPEIWLGEPDQLSVDAFLYARCAVVARGRDIYSGVRADPTRMPKDAEFESLLYVASTAYERKTGLEWDDLDDTEMSYETFSNEAGWPKTE